MVSSGIFSTKSEVVTRGALSELAWNDPAEKIWKLEDNNVQTTWMAYGLQSEAAAINKYQLQTSHVVSPSGLWVNPDFPYLACTPDGLIGDDGVLEIKSLKLFKEHSINDVINDNGTLIPKETVKRQCFTIEDNKCVLKKTHSYYYQVQLQLLVTDRSFCDFVLYAENGPVNIERIYRDVLINDILIALTALWQRVIAPELYSDWVCTAVMSNDVMNDLRG